MWKIDSIPEPDKTYFSTILMGLPLRLTFGDQDLVFQILDTQPFDCGNGIAIAFNGETYQLYRLASQWRFKETSPQPDHNLASAIGKAISLRYRI
jgi:hypothetical protein